MVVGYDNQVGANDCAYWTGNHTDGYGTEHTPRGIHDYWNPGFAWSNWGSGYDDFEIEVVRQDNGGSFTNKGEETATITFSGEDVWALVESSDGEKPDFASLLGSPPEHSGMEEGAYYVPVYYNTYVYLGGHQPW